MVTKHLTIGSELPSKTDDKLRLYSMEYCPYVQRVRLVLAAKNIPYELININLIKKPEWYFKVNPGGKVPALDTGSKVMIESLDIANYLDEAYPNPPLYPSEPAARELDKDLIEKISPLTGVFVKILLTQKEEKTPEQWVKELLPHLQVFEKELEKRGTPFFFGEKPGMVDYMLWPWAERAGTIAIHLGQKLPFADEVPFLRKWKKLMREDPAVASLYHGPEKFYKCVQIKIGVLPPDYDSI